MRFKCLLGTEIPDGKIYEFCGEYERDEKESSPKTSSDIFRGLFGGI
jgi:hypothetical protein